MALCFPSATRPKSKSKWVRRAVGGGALPSPKWGHLSLVELGLRNPLAAALGAKGESEMPLARRVLSAQPARSLLPGDRYYGVGAVLADLSALEERHFPVRVKANLKRRFLEAYPDGSALVEIGTGGTSAWGERSRGRCSGPDVGPHDRSLVDQLAEWSRHPASELLALYARRWEQ